MKKKAKSRAKRPKLSATSKIAKSSSLKLKPTSNQTGAMSLLSITHNPIFYSEANREQGLDKFPVMTGWFFNPILGQPRGVVITNLRDFSKSIWVNICIRTIIDEVLAMGWDIVPEDPDAEIQPHSDEQLMEVREFFKGGVNINNESFDSILRKTLQDLIALDSGVIVKVFSEEAKEEKEKKEVETNVLNKDLKSFETMKITKQPLKTEEERKGKLSQLMSSDGGCFKFGTMIETDLGMIPIGKIVNDKIQCKVKSYNKETKEIEWKPITNWFNNGVTTEWIRLKAKTHRKLRSMNVTPNHNIFTPEGYVQAGTLNVGDIVYTQQEELSKDQDQIILGSLLGDGCLKKGSTKHSKYYFSETHGIKQKEYLLWKADMLKPLGISSYEYMSRYDENHKYTQKININTKANMVFEDYHKLKYPKFNPDIAHKLTALGLAVWVLDDGNYTPSGAYRISCGKIEKETLQTMAEIIKSRFDIEFKVMEGKRENMLSTNQEMGQRLKELIKPYVHPSMAYKVGHEECGQKLPELDKKTKSDIIETEIYEKSYIDYYDAKYDIEIADNHNYFAQGILVSNSFLKDMNMFGMEFGYYQYSFKHPGMAPLWFDKSELVFIMQNPRSDNPYGWSHIQSIREVLEPMQRSLVWNKEFFTKGSIPKGMMIFEDMDDESIKRMGSMWKEKIMGEGHGLPIFNKKGEFMNLQMTSREMEFLDSQKWYFKLVLAQFKLTPTEIGFTEDSNKASAVQQTGVNYRKTLKPLTSLLEHHINTDIIPEFGFEGISFKFNEVTPEEKERELENDLKRVTAKTMTVNEFRAIRGEEPLEGADEIDFGTPAPFGMGEEKPFEEQDEKDKEKETEKDGKDKPKKQLNQLNQIKVTETKNGDIKIFVPDSEIIPVNKAAERFGMEEIDDQADTYDAYIVSQYLRMERKILSRITDDNFQKSYRKKLFGDFLQIVFSSVMVTSFYDRVKTFVKKDFKKGMKTAEDDLNRKVDVDIGFTERNEKTVEWITNQQIEGYVLQDGKEWSGLKGDFSKTQINVIKSIEEGIREGENTKQLKGRVQSIFKTAKDRQAQVIARTETNRITNMGHLEGYKNSNVPMRKKWVSFLDDRTSDICKRLNNQIVELDGLFRDPETSKVFQSPPSHPSCRSRIVSVLD